MSQSSRPFQSYAEAYDSLYQEKDYTSETRFVEEVVQRFSERKVHSILDLGCGTGGHAIPLALQGYEVTGVDLSREMLARAQVKGAQAGVERSLSFIEGDIAAVHVGKKFDMIICMFAVLSYQTSNERLQSAFSVVREHLKPGGVFLCDFWYGPAALRDLPIRREKTVTHNTRRIHRVATPSIDFNSNVVQVTYDVTAYEGDKVVLSTSEMHSMRYFFLPELSLVGGLHDLELLYTCGCCDIQAPVSEETWTVSAIYRG
jgi:SAM-dependent methyltransferase